MAGGGRASRHSEVVAVTGERCASYATRSNGSSRSGSKAGRVLQLAYKRRAVRLVAIICMAVGRAILVAMRNRRARGGGGQSWRVHRGREMGIGGSVKASRQQRGSDSKAPDDDIQQAAQKEKRGALLLLLATCGLTVVGGLQAGIAPEQAMQSFASGAPMQHDSSSWPTHALKLLPIWMQMQPARLGQASPTALHRTTLAHSLSR